MRGSHGFPFQIRTLISGFNLLAIYMIKGEDLGHYLNSLYSDEFVTLGDPSKLF
jgi:hypothetical protein